jgi:nucleoside phosphorylase
MWPAGGADMNWFTELRVCELDVFAGIAVDAYRTLKNEGAPIGITEFLYEASEVLAGRADVRPADRLRILLPLSYELYRGRFIDIYKILAPVLAELRETDVWEESMTEQLKSFGLTARRATTEKTTVLEPIRSSDVEGRVVIVTAKDEEFEEFLSFPSMSERKLIPGHRTATRPGEDIVVVSADEMGNIFSALTTKLAIDKWNPGLVVLAGIAGGFEEVGEKVRLGDVLVPGVVVGYEAAKVLPGETKYRIKVAQAGSNAMAIAKEVAAKNWFRQENVKQMDAKSPSVHFDGALMSGEKVVADLVEVDRLKRIWGDAVGAEMEGIGLMIAAYRDTTRPEALVVKAISDWADSNKDDDFHHFAAYAAASFAMAVSEQWVETYRTVSRHPLEFPEIKDINGFSKRVNDDEAITIAIQIGIEQDEFGIWDRGRGGRYLLLYVQRHNLLSKLVDAILKLKRLELIPYLY